MAWGFLPIEYFGLLLALFVAVTISFVWRWYDDYCYLPERKMFKQARKSDRPLLSVEDPSTGRGRFVLGEKNKDGSPIFDDDEYGIKIDPSFVSGDATPTRYPYGLAIWHTASTKSLPISQTTALSYQTMKDHRRDNKRFKALDFLTDKELFSLLRSNRDDLDKNAKNFLERYKPMMELAGEHLEMDVNEFVTLLKDMQDFYSTLTIDKGTELSNERGDKAKYHFFTYFKAFKDLPFAHCSQDTERIKYLLEKIFWKEFADRDKLWTYVIMSIAVMGTIGIVVFLISTVVK